MITRIYEFFAVIKNIVHNTKVVVHSEKVLPCDTTAVSQNTGILHGKAQVSIYNIKVYVMGKCGGNKLGLG